MFSHHQRVHARSTNKPVRRGYLNSTLEKWSDSDEDDSDLEPSAGISEASASEVISPAKDPIRDPTSGSRKLRDELEAISQEFDTRMETLKREYKAELKRAIDLVEEKHE